MKIENRPPDLPNAQLQALGERIRMQRKALGVSAMAAAEAAGVSRVTLHRIEKGEGSVNAGAWADVMAALGLVWEARLQREQPANAVPADLAAWLPAEVLLADYPQLKALAWQVHGDALRPQEAFDIYERNARHLDQAQLSERERALRQALRTAFGGALGGVFGGVARV
jgi:transcriptional regulator with XRE-family HTH domain